MDLDQELINGLQDTQRNFSYLASHQIRGPICTLEGLVEILTIQPHTSETGKVAEMLQETIRRLKQQLDESIRLFEPPSHTLNSLNEIFWPDLVQKVFERLFADLPEDVVTLKLEGEVRHLLHYSNFLSKVLYELMFNAYRFRHRLKPLLIVIKSHEDQNSFRFTVKDNGMGFNLEEQNYKLFTPFCRLHEEVSGQGLGLYHLEILIRQLRGSINVQSKVMSGTSVEVILPKIA